MRKWVSEEYVERLKKRVSFEIHDTGTPHLKLLHFSDGKVVERFELAEPQHFIFKSKEAYGNYYSVAASADPVQPSIGLIECGRIDDVSEVAQHLEGTVTLLKNLTGLELRNFGRKELRELTPFFKQHLEEILHYANDPCFCAFAWFLGETIRRSKGAVWALELYSFGNYAVVDVGVPLHPWMYLFEFVEGGGKNLENALKRV